MKQGTSGTYGSESLPNITGDCWGGIAQSALAYQTTGVFKAKIVGPNKVAPNSLGAYPDTNGFDFNASWSSSVYQDNAKVNPDNAEIMYCIKY